MPKMVITQVPAFTSRPLPARRKITTWAMKPTVIPAAIEKVNGISTAISITGTAVAISSQSRRPRGARKPAATKTSAGAVAKGGIEAKSGSKNRQSRNICGLFRIG